MVAEQAGKIGRKAIPIMYADSMTGKLPQVIAAAMAFVVALNFGFNYAKKGTIFDTRPLNYIDENERAAKAASK
eukprot:tig00020960_g16607.t1